MKRERSWTLASVTALFGAVACGSFGAESAGGEPATTPPTADGGADATTDGSGPIDIGPPPPPCNGETDLKTSPDHCGACDHSCGGGVCAAGKCQPVTLLENVADPGYLRERGDALYFVTQTAIHQVFKQTKRGTARLLDGAFGAGIAVDETHVYAAGSGGVLAIPHAGGLAVPITPIPKTEVAVRGGELLVCDSRAEKEDLLKFPRLGGAEAVKLVKDTTLCHSIAIAPDNTAFFSGEKIFRIVDFAKKDQGAVEVPESGPARRLAVDAESIYSTAQSSTQILRRPLGGGKNITTIESPEPIESGDLALDATHVYWTTGTEGGGVYRAPKTGGAVEEVAKNESFPRGIAVDQEAIYWTNGSTASRAGDVRKLVK